MKFCFAEDIEVVFYIHENSYTPASVFDDCFMNLKTNAVGYELFMKNGDNNDSCFSIIEDMYALAKESKFSKIYARMNLYIELSEKEYDILNILGKHQPSENLYFVIDAVRYLKEIFEILDKKYIETVDVLDII